jgi:hypothetical protein
MEALVPAATAHRTIETIVQLAEEIGRAAPECAGKAMQIVELARMLEAGPDQSTIQDALDSQAFSEELSDMGSQNAAREVARALKE